MTIPASESTQEMKEACDYLMIPFNEKSIRTNNLSKLIEIENCIFHCYHFCKIYSFKVQLLVKIIYINFLLITFHLMHT